MMLAEFYQRKLFDGCLPFWFPRAVDESHGGCLHCLDGDGTLLDEDKSVWAQGRMSWMLLTLYQERERRAEWLAWAESGLRFLQQKCVDPADRRMFFSVARDGTPLRKRRYAKYLGWHEQIREWAFRHFEDLEHGEWFGYLHRDGTRSNSLKGSLWKSFFHHPRALWRCHQLAVQGGP